MKKIFDWTIGSFFRSIGRIIAYLVIGGLIGFLLYQCDSIPNLRNLIGIDYVYAINSAGWAKDLPSLQQTLMKDCTGTNTCNTDISVTNAVTQFDDGLSRRFVVNSLDLNIASNGVMVLSNFGRMKSGYIYQVNYYICSNDNLNPSGSSFYISAVDYSNPGVKHNTYELFSSSALSGAPFGSNGEAWSYCRKFESLIVPNDNYNWVGIRFKNMSSVDTLNIISYEVEELGIYTSELETIVNRAVTSATSNLVTSSQLNNATQQIQTEQQNTTNAIDSGFNSTCSNVFNQSNNSNSCSSCTNVVNSNGITITCNDPNYNYCYYNYTLTGLTSNTTYNLSFTKNKSVGKVLVLDSNWGNIETINDNGTFNTGNNTSIILRFYSTIADGPLNYNKVMISPITSNYCSFGSDINRLDQTNQGINNLNDTLNDTNTNQDTTDASNFFHNFDIGTDHLVSSLVMLPINVLQNLINYNNTNDLCFTLKGKTSCFPNGKILWGKTQRSGINWFGTSNDISIGVNAFKIFFNLLVGGYLCYRFLMDIVKIIEKALDPVDSYVEVMKL